MVSGRLGAEKLRVGYFDFPPLISANAQGRAEGLTAELVEKYASGKGFEVDFVRADSWAKNFEALTSGKIDAIAAMHRTPEREKLFAFTASYVHIPLYFISKRDREPPSSHQGSRIVLPRRAQIVSIIQEKYPKANIVFNDDTLASLLQVAFGTADYAAMPLSLAAHYLQSENFQTLTVVGDAITVYDFCVAHSFSKRKFLSDFEAFMLEEGNEIVKEFQNRWAPRSKWENFVRHYGMWIGLLIVVSTAGFWIFSLHRQKRKLTRTVDEAHRLISAVIDQIPDEIAVRNQNGIFLLANKAYCRSVEKKKEAIIGRHVRQVYTSEEACLPILESDARILKDNLIESSIERRKSERHPIRWFRVSKLPMSAKTGSAEVLAIATDITDTRNKTESLQQFRALINESHDGIYVIDPATARYVDCNLAAHMTLGYTREELLSMSVLDIATHVTDKSVWEQRAKLVADKGSLVFETEYRHKDGLIFPVEVSATMHTTGEKTVMIAFARDITERKANELQLKQAKADAEKANQEKSRFLARMTHELRTPLNGVIGIVNMLKLSELNPAQKQYVDLIVSSSHSLLSLINDTLDFSKIESQKMELEKTPFNLGQLVRETLEMSRPMAIDQDIEIEGDFFDNEPPLMIISDAMRLRQTLLNLLANAIKFTQKGKIIFSAGITAKDQKAVSVHFSVKDTGIGISRMDQERIFRPFAQVGEGTARLFGGTGLGLSISAHLVSLFGGKLSVESAPGDGSNFFFELEFERAQGSPSAIPDSSPSLDFVDSHLAEKCPLDILVAEDNSINSFVIRELLLQLGYSCKVVENGNQALEAIKEQPFDVILMDVLMPELDGLEATRQIRALYAGRKPYVIALTANVSDQDREDCYSAGMEDFLPKPFTMRELQEVLKTAYQTLSRARSAR